VYSGHTALHQSYRRKTETDDRRICDDI